MRTEKCYGRGEAVSLLILMCTLFLGLVISGEGGEYVKEGMRLAVGCVIPSSFPFMIISDMYVHYGRPENLRHVGALFYRVFGIPPSGVGAFICGNVCGFPLGAKMCSDAYAAGALKREDAQRLIPLCNNPSCAFVIGGVGVGMYSDVRIGFMLLISVYAATAICGIITRRSVSKSCNYGDNQKQKYDFVESVKRAGINSVSIISFICLFSVVCGILKKRIKNALVLYPVYAFLEVTNAVKGLSDAGAFSPVFRLSVSAFALGFGGVCVGVQSSCFTSSVGLKMKGYYPIKILEGILAGCLFSLLYQI